MYFIKRVSKKDLAPGIKRGMFLIIHKKNRYKNKEVVIYKTKNKNTKVMRIYGIQKPNKYILKTDKQPTAKGNIVNKNDIKGSVVKIIPKKIARLICIIALFVTIASVVAITALILKIVNNDNSKVSNTVILNSPTPTLKPKNFTLGEVKRDINYCGDQAIDLYEPRVAVYEAQPVVIYLHGGGWRNNNKSTEKDQLELIDGLRDKGFAIISADYRKAPENSYPSQINDATCLVRFLKSNSELYNLDEFNIGVYGFSAGGQLAAMLGVLNDNMLFNNGQYNSKDSRVYAVVTLAGIFDFNNGLKSNNLFNIQSLNIPDPVSSAAPITYVGKNDSPFFLIHGEQDQFVLTDQDILFSNKLSEAGVKHEYLLVKNADHGLNPMQAEPIPTRQEVGNQIKQFFIDNLKNR